MALTVTLDPTLVRYSQEQARLFYRKLVDRVRDRGALRRYPSGAVFLSARDKALDACWWMDIKPGPARIPRRY